MERLSRRELEKSARKKDIIDAALVLFSEKDFHEVTVDEIAERVGLSKGTLYLYFDNKESLFFSIIKDKTESLLAQLQSAIKADAPYIERLEELIRTYLVFFEEHKPYFKVIHSEKSRMGDEDHNRLRNHMVESFFSYNDLLLNFINEGQQNRIFRKLKPDLITKTLRGLLNSFTFECIFMDTECSLVNETSNILDIFLNGVSVR